MRPWLGGRARIQYATEPHTTPDVDSETVPPLVRRHDVPGEARHDPEHDGDANRAPDPASSAIATLPATLGTQHRVEFGDACFAVLGGCDPVVVE
jgi:hypothetical protein